MQHPLKFCLFLILIHAPEQIFFSTKSLPFSWENKTSSFTLQTLLLSLLVLLAVVTVAASVVGESAKQLSSHLLISSRQANQLMRQVDRSTGPNFITDVPGGCRKIWDPRLIGQPRCACQCERKRSRQGSGISQEQAGSSQGDGKEEAPADRTPAGPPRSKGAQRGVGRSCVSPCPLLLVCVLEAGRGSLP